MDELFLQLARRVQSFKDRTGLSSRQICRLSGISEQQMSDFLNGRRGLGTSHTIQLLQVLNGSKKAHPKTAQIAHFQQNGRELAGTLRFDLPDYGGFVPGESGEDSNDTAGIDSTPTARDVPGSDDYLQQMVGFLKQQQEIYRQAISHIDDYLAGIQKAKPNTAGVTEGPGHIDDNAVSSKPGPRPDRFSQK